MGTFLVGSGMILLAVGGFVYHGARKFDPVEPWPIPPGAVTGSILLNTLGTIIAAGAVAHGRTSWMWLNLLPVAGFCLLWLIVVYKEELTYT